VAISLGQISLISVSDPLKEIATLDVPAGSLEEDPAELYRSNLHIIDLAPVAGSLSGDPTRTGI
jgi:hypothetical protein